MQMLTLPPIEDEKGIEAAMISEDSLITLGRLVGITLRTAHGALLTLKAYNTNTISQTYEDKAAADRKRYEAEYKTVYGFESGTWQSEASKINAAAKRQAKSAATRAAKQSGTAT